MPAPYFPETSQRHQFFRESPCARFMSATQGRALFKKPARQVRFSDFASFEINTCTAEGAGDRFIKCATEEIQCREGGKAEADGRWAAAAAAFEFGFTPNRSCPNCITVEFLAKLPAVIAILVCAGAGTVRYGTVRYTGVSSH